MVFHLCFENDIVASDAKVDVTLANEGWDICSRQKNAKAWLLLTLHMARVSYVQCDRVVFYKRDV